MHIIWLEEKGIGAEEMRCNGVEGENYENLDHVEGGGAEALVGIDLVLGFLCRHRFSQNWFSYNWNAAVI